MSFTKKIVEVRITLTSGTFSGSANTKIIRGLPVKVEISNPGFPAMSSATISISGINQDDLEALTFLAFRPLTYAQGNILSVYGGDEETGLSLAFMGNIVTSVPNYNAAPNVTLEIEAMAGYYAKLLAVPPYTFKGSIPVASVLQDICEQAGLVFVNEGETKSILNPYLKGSPLQKIITLANSYNLNIALTGETVTLKSSQGNNRVVTVLNSNSGMIGYPDFTANGIRVKSEYLPTVNVGDFIKVESAVPKATGLWSIISINHSLGAHMDDAPWFTTIEANYPGGL
ncbi:MAG: hypothetical protein KHX55_02540 [Proteobacteria bacterium]|nr:hypothetical protein [Pseudomonadota bacterium]